MGNQILPTKDSTDSSKSSVINRRSFIIMSGATALTAAFVVACKKKDEPGPQVDNGVDLGSGDVGILNYAYALEQLEAAFYTKVVAEPYNNMPTSEMILMTDIKNHEIAHRDFFKAALGANAIQALEVDFSSIDFKSREKVLGAAKTFEDLGVSAYNGAGKLLTNPDYLVLAGKIVSVEARHAAAIRDLISPMSASFAGDDVVDAKGLDVYKSPADVLAAAGTYIKTKINASNLPK